jgi:hypothetical protein
MYKGFTELLILLILFVGLSGIIYHNGLQSNCPVCITNSSYSKFINQDIFEIYTYDSILVIHLESSNIIPSVITKTVFSTRAPPAYL